MFELMATGLPAHLLIHHVSIRSHLGPSVSWATYASLMAQVLLNAPAASLVVALLAGRTDMAPSGARLAALQRVKSGQAQPGAAALSEDAPAPPLPFATRALVAVHRAQLFVQEHMQPAVVAASAVVGLWALLRGFRAITQRTDMRLCLHISEYLLLIPSLYMLGTQNVLTTLKPRLAVSAGALPLGPVDRRDDSHAALGAAPPTKARPRWCPQPPIWCLAGRAHAAVRPGAAAHC